MFPKTSPILMAILLSASCQNPQSPELGVGAGASECELRLETHGSQEPVLSAVARREPLGRTKGGDYLEDIMEFIESLAADADWEVRRFAAYGLGFLEDERVMDTLEKLAKDANWAVREMAVRSIARHPDAGASGKGAELLKGALSDSIWRVRLAACEGLGSLKDRSFADALFPLLEDPDADVRSTAIIGLAGMADEGLFRELLERLSKSPHPWWRRICSSGMGEYGDATVEGHDPHAEAGWRIIELVRRFGRAEDSAVLTPLLGASDFMERLNAATAMVEVSADVSGAAGEVLLEALGYLGSENPPSEFDEERACRLLRRIIPGTRAFIGELCGIGEGAQRWQASDEVLRGLFKAVSSVGDSSVVPCLIDFFANEGNDHYLRMEAIGAAAVLGDFDAQREVLLGEWDGRTEVKTEVIRSMVETAEQKQRDLLGHLLEVGDQREKREVVYWQGCVRRRLTVDELVQVIEDEKDWEIRHYALGALSMINLREPERFLSLVDVYDEESCPAEVKAIIVRILSMYPTERYGNFFRRAIHDESHAVRIEAVKALAFTEGLPVLLEALESEENEDVLSEMICAIRRRPSEDSSRTLEKTVREGRTSRLRNFAFRSLASMDDEAARRIALEMLDCGDSNLRSTCIEYLGGLEEESLLNVFLAKMNGDAVAEVRAQAVRALIALKESGGDRLRDEFVKRAREDESEVVRQEVVDALSWYDDPSLIPLFKEIVQNDKCERTRFAAGAALSSWGSDDARNLFVDFLARGTNLEQKWALGVLAENPIHDDCIMKQLLRLSREHEEVAALAMRALGGLGSIESLKALMVLLVENLDRPWLTIAATEAIIEMRVEVMFPLLRELLRDALGRVGGVTGDELEWDVIAAFSTSYYVSRYEEELLREFLEKAAEVQYVEKARLRLAHGYSERFEFEKAAMEYAAVGGMESPIRTRHVVALAYEKLCRAMLLHQSGEHQVASRVVDDAVREVPDEHSGALYNFAAWHLAGMGVSLEAALVYAELAVDLAPQDAGAIDTLGWTLYRIGRFEDGLRYLNEASYRSHRTNPLIEFHRALSLARVGRIREARRVLNWAMRMDSELPCIFENSDERLIFEDACQEKE